MLIAQGCDLLVLIGTLASKLDDAIALGSIDRSIREVTSVDFVLTSQVEVIVVRRALYDYVGRLHLEIAYFVHWLKETIATTSLSWRCNCTFSRLSTVHILDCFKLVYDQLPLEVIIDANHGLGLLQAHILHEPALQRYLNDSLVILQVFQDFPSLQVTHRVTNVED